MIGEIVRRADNIMSGNRVRPSAESAADVSLGLPSSSPVPFSSSVISQQPDKHHAVSVFAEAMSRDVSRGPSRIGGAIGGKRGTRAAAMPMNRSFSMTISNAHQFAPHPSIRYMDECDMLLVQEDDQPFLTTRVAAWGLKFGVGSTENRYRVFDRNNSLLYSAIDESPCGCCHRCRPILIHISDDKGDEVMSLRKDCACGIIHCGQEMLVYSPPDNLIGTVSESCGIINPTYYLFDATAPDVPLFEVRGPTFTCSCFCDDVDFPVIEKGNKRFGGDKRVGFISKKWGGMAREILSTTDTFGVTFPLHFDPRFKALFMAACFLIVSVHG